MGTSSWAPVLLRVGGGANGWFGLVVDGPNMYNVYICTRSLPTYTISSFFFSFFFFLLKTSLPSVSCPNQMGLLGVREFNQLHGHHTVGEKLAVYKRECWDSLDFYLWKKMAIITHSKSHCSVVVDEISPCLKCICVYTLYGAGY